jgi:hypothetical protein
MLAAVTDRWNRFFFEGCTPAQLGALRICLGFGLIPFHLLQFGSLLALAPSGAHFYYLEQIWYFDWLGIDTLQPGLAFAALAVLLVSTLSFALGCFTRTSLFIMLLCVAYLKGVRDSVAGDVHHRYLIPVHVLLPFLLSKSGQVFSIDNLRRRGTRSLPAVAEWEASWPIKAGQLYICSFYFWSAIAKARMSGTSWSADRLQHLLVGRAVRFGFEDGVPAGSNLAYTLAHSEWLCQALASATYVFEFGFPLILLIRDTRLRLAFFAGITLFHVSNFILLNVQFLFLPIVFLLFFDISRPFRIRLVRDSHGDQT